MSWKDLIDIAIRVFVTVFYIGFGFILWGLFYK